MLIKEEKPSGKERKRLVFLSLGVLALFCLLIVQFYKIQIVEGEKWTKEALSQHQLLIKEPPRRGIFYSNPYPKVGHPESPEPLVLEVAKFHLYVDPLSIPEEAKEEISSTLAGYPLLPDKEKIHEQLAKKSRSRKLAMWLDKQTQDRILVWWSSYARKKKIARNALYFVQDYQRSYPFGKLLGQVLHTVREDRHPFSGQGIPTGGLELVFDAHLKGKEGKRVILRSPRHPLESSRVLTAPEAGADVYLTINHYLQAIAEEEVAKAVQKVHAKGGWAIMMDPYTGEILAWAQYPWFEPCAYAKFFNDEKLREETKVKGITDPYEPGSTFKPLTLAICLKASLELQKRGQPPLFNPRDKIATAEGYFPGRSTPLRDVRTHRYLNMYLALQKSSNVYMARMVQRVIETLGADWYRNALQETFGLGLKTGIELPAESAGMLPMPGKTHPNGALEWSAPTPYSLAIGHNILVNSLQMLRSYAILANGGYDVQPTLVRKISKSRPDGSQEILFDRTREENFFTRKRVLDPYITKEIVAAMQLVTKPGGTAQKADIYGYSEAGKTGTAEKIIEGRYSKDHYFSSFVGFAPVKNPRFVLMIAIDEPEPRFIPGVGKTHHGGQCAAPVFREIGRRSLQYLGVEPDDPYGYPVGDPRHDAEKAEGMRWVRELQELYRDWNVVGVRS